MVHRKEWGKGIKIAAPELGYGSVVKHLPSMCGVLAWIPSTARGKKSITLKEGKVILDVDSKEN
jgi:hypothetical protein